MLFEVSEVGLQRSTLYNLYNHHLGAHGATFELGVLVCVNVNPQVGPHLGLHRGFYVPRVGHTSGITEAAGCPRWGHHSDARGVPHPPPSPGYRTHYTMGQTHQHHLHTG